MGEVGQPGLGTELGFALLQWLNRWSPVFLWDSPSPSLGLRVFVCDMTVLAYAVVWTWPLAGQGRGLEGSALTLRP